jgi:Thiolase, N-terminal domain
MLRRPYPSSSFHHYHHHVPQAFSRAIPYQTPPSCRKLARPDDVVITYAKRTPIGRAWKGQFKDVPVDELLNALFKASLAESKLDPHKIDDICVGKTDPPISMQCVDRPKAPAIPHRLYTFRGRLLLQQASLPKFLSPL